MRYANNGQAVMDMGDEQAEQAAVDAENRRDIRRTKTEDEWYRGQSLRLPSGEHGVFLNFGSGGKQSPFAHVLNGRGGKVVVSVNALRHANEEAGLLI